MQFLKTKKLAVIVMLSAVALSGCFNLSSKTTTTVDDKNKLYETADYTVTLPKEWDVIGKDKFTSDIPQNTDVVFRNNVKNETFTANINILKNKLLQTITTSDYAKMVLNREASGLTDYSEKRRDSYNVSIGGANNASLLAEFEGRKSTGDQLVHYVQVYAVKNNDAYIVTAAVDPKDTSGVLNTVQNIVKSFKVK